ncbi:MAG: ribosome biogenesis GTPase Der [Magnetococcales bacterium]|nr:ribosome biogenesis GTPase Der [Magnetococcales bacterium]
MNKVTQNLPIVALVGRPNVGKSSIFNRFTKSRDALVDDTPGLTRDRQYGRVIWNNRAFHVVDTGGFEPKSDDVLPNLMREQTMVAVEEADVVIFVTDAKSGPLPDDWSIGDMLRRSNKPVICAVNKTEGKGGVESAYEFYGLGINPVIPVAAAHGRGMEELRSAVMEMLPLEDSPEVGGGDDKVADLEGEGAVDELAQKMDFAQEVDFEEEIALAEQEMLTDGEPAEEVELEDDHHAVKEEIGEVGVAVVGCPNAGKSSLINALLGEKRLVASEVAGTTRDSIDLPFTDSRGHKFVLIDTAGIRRKSRIALKIEKFSVMAALKAIDRAEIAVLVLDAQREDISDQDRRVATLATNAGCGLVIVVNKWDLIKGGRKAQKEYLQRVQDAFPLFPHAPVLFISSKKNKGIDTLLATAHKVYRVARQRVSTGRLNRWLKETVEKHPPPRRAGRAIKIRYMTQIATEPPTLLIFANRPDQVHETYRRYMEKQLREQFDFAGVPVRLLFRKGGNPFEKSD